MLCGVVSDSLGDDVVCVEGVGAGQLHDCELYNRGWGEGEWSARELEKCAVERSQLLISQHSCLFEGAFSHETVDCDKLLVQSRCVRGTYRYQSCRTVPMQ